MYLSALKLKRILFPAAVIAVVLALLFPAVVPFPLAIALGVLWLGLFVYTVLHIRMTRRADYRCPECGWAPFALHAWKCKECRFVWDAFATDGVCPHCDHEHDELACVRCRRISSKRAWRGT